MASAAAGLIVLQVGPIIVMMALSMAFAISAHPGRGVQHVQEGKPFMLHSRSLSAGANEKVDIKLNTTPSPNSNSLDKEYVKVGRGARAFRPARRFMEAEGFSFRPGSTPPNCEGKCQGCTPCDLQPIVIPHMVSVSSVDYKYEHWACVCKMVTYLTNTRT